MIAQCKHNCTNCLGYETTGECNHGCFDCIHFDGGNCINIESNYYNCTGDICAANCHVWNNKMSQYWTLDDLRAIALKSGNNNPGIFLLSESDKDAEDAFAPTDIFIDDDGDIIIKFDEGFLVGFKEE